MAITSDTNQMLTLDMIQGEFGGPGSPIDLRNYYRGGAYVPNSPANSGVPTSGVIDILDFYGAANITELAISVTMGFDSESSPFVTTSWTGYNSTQGIGARSPTAVNGATILSLLQTITAVGGQPDPVRSFGVGLSGSRAQGFFEYVKIQGSNGAITELQSSAATFSQSGGNTGWSWFIASNVWSAGVSPRTVTFGY